MGEATGARWVGQLVQEAVSYLAPRPPWTLKGSEEIWAGLNEQPVATVGAFPTVGSLLPEKTHGQSRSERDGLTVATSLVNWQTDLPARDVEINLAQSTGAGGKVTKVWLRRQPLRAAAKGDARVVIVPEVGLHVMVVFDCEYGSRLFATLAAGVNLIRNLSES